MADAARHLEELAGAGLERNQALNHQIDDVVGGAERGDRVEVPGEPAPRLERQMPLPRQPLEELSDEEWVARGLLADQRRQRRHVLTGLRERVEDQLANIGRGKGAELDAV